MARVHSAKSVVRIVIDVAMAAVYVALMATALVQEVPHEYLGIALFALVVAHVVLNWRWFAALARGRYDALRAVQLVAVVGLLACIVAQVASSLVLSKHAFGFLPAVPGAGWARSIHMLCSYWAFVLAFAHAGLRARAPKNMAPWQKWAVRIIIAAVACFGAFSFAQLGLGQDLTGQVQFAFADYSVPFALAFARYASVAVLVAGVFHYVRRGIEIGRAHV